MVNIIIRHFFAVIVLLAVGCGKEYGPEEVPGSTGMNYSLFDRYVDESGNEGVVGEIYNDPDGMYNYVLILSADETEAYWGPTDETVYTSGDKFNKGYISGPFFGLEMNQIVEHAGVERFPAFEWCQAKNKDGRSIHSGSWILPTYSELSIIFRNGIDRLNEAIAGMGGIPISADGYYWSSVEDIDGAFRFSDETLPGNSDYDQARRAVPMTSDRTFPVNKIFWSKINWYRVRAIKYIYFGSKTKDEIESMTD